MGGFGSPQGDAPLAEEPSGLNEAVLNEAQMENEGKVTSATEGQGSDSPQGDAPPQFLQATSLASCGSNQGTQVGPSRNGYCAMANVDTHAVCVTMPTDFCVKTGQTPDWCKEGNYEGGPWCICMWAYARYVENNGCNSITVNTAATDVAGICAKYSDDVGGGGADLSVAHGCL